MNDQVQSILIIHISVMNDTSKFIKIRQMSKYQELQAFYLSLPPKDTSFLQFNNLSIRELDHKGRLQRIFFGIGCALVDISDRTGSSFIIMNTASHNPPGYNGLKVQSFQPLTIDGGQVSKIINDQTQTLQLLKKICGNGLGNNNSAFYLGRDKRLTSSRLSSIIKNLLQVLGRRVIDLGERTTPQLFSLSQFIHTQQKIENVAELTNKYFEIVKESFCQAIKLIEINLGRKWMKKSICLDLANGVGVQSLKNYQFLYDYFQMHLVNYQRFDLPNVECGADTIYTQFKRTSLVPLKNYPKADEYYFFDGDSDRIIGNMGENDRIMDGDDFTACFVRLIKDLFSLMDLKDETIGAVINILSNDSLIRYLRTLNVNSQQVPVGVKEAYAAIQKYNIGCYFELCGHGNLYFSEKMRQILLECRQKHWQARILLCMDGLSRNNSRGYALHDMLIMQIYMFYFNAQSPYLFEKSYILIRQYQLKNPQVFQNSNEGKQLLEKPLELIQIAAKLQDEFKEGGIVLRKSNTTPVLRVSIQGKKQNCQFILKLLQQRLSDYVK